jgi:acyl-CoA synthetase (AMP-forming)/AMP-acid ligase II
MDSCRTFIEVLQRRAAESPDRPAFIFLGDGESVEATWTYAVLERRARAVAAVLQERTAAGNRVLLCYPPGLEFLAGLFGCLLAGVVAVPVYPPRLNRSAERLRGVLVSAQPRLVLTTTEIAGHVANALASNDWLHQVPWIGSELLPLDAAEQWRDPVVDGEALAFLQYTSGSTGTPRGVMVSHANLLANQRHIRDCFGHHAGIAANVSWLPVYHDMGLVGNVFHPIYMGMPLVQLSPLAVLQRPLRWLQAIARFGAHTSGAPNFAYDLCVQRIKPDQRDQLDLRSWQVAYIGAEPIRQATLEAFACFFGPCGFRRAAFLPCYGLAEATLFVTGQRGETILEVCPEVLQQGTIHLTERRAGVWLVSSGQTPADVDVRVVDPESASPMLEGQIGEVWVRGPQVGQGYWSNPEATTAVFTGRLMDGTGPFLRTGDLGFLRNGQLFVTGRVKDLIILDGRNHYPQDIEWSIQGCHLALRPNAGAAFAIEAEGTERLVIVQEVERSGVREDLRAIQTAIRQAVTEQHDVAVHEVVLVRPNAVPRTSSGKIQRSYCRQLYLRGELELAFPTGRSDNEGRDVASARLM